MSEGAIDSVTAAKGATRLFFIAIVVGAVSGLAAWVFLTIDHYGVEFLWHELPAMVPSVPEKALSAIVVALMTLAAVLVVVIVRRRPFDMGHAEAEYDSAGRMDYRHLFSGAIFSLASLFSGAAVGPEAPLTDIGGGLGTFAAERLGLNKDTVKVMAYAGVAGAFGAFFGVAPVGALLAAELISPKSVNISRTSMVVGLTSAATAWVVYSQLGGHSVSQLFSFPEMQAIGLVDIGLAILLGAVGGLIGLVYGGALLKTRAALTGLRARPWLAGLVGGGATIAVATLAPVLLFSGQSQMPDVISNAASIGVLMLLALGVGKLAFNAISLSSAYFGGPIFPIMFAGACFGLAVNLLLPAVPQGVAVMAIITGMTIAAAVAPLSVTVFLALLVDPVLIPVIAIAAVAAFIVRQLIAPTLPGIYRAAVADADARKAEAESA